MSTSFDFKTLSDIDLVYLWITAIAEKRGIDLEVLKTEIKSRYGSVPPQVTESETGVSWPQIDEFVADSLSQAHHSPDSKMSLHRILRISLRVFGSVSVIVAIVYFLNFNYVTRGRSFLSLAVALIASVMAVLSFRFARILIDKLFINIQPRDLLRVLREGDFSIAEARPDDLSPKPLIHFPATQHASGKHRMCERILVNHLRQPYTKFSDLLLVFIAVDYMVCHTSQREHLAAKGIEILDYLHAFGKESPTIEYYLGLYSLYLGDWDSSLRHLRCYAEYRKSAPESIPPYVCAEFMKHRAEK